MDKLNVQVFLSDLRLKNGFSKWLPALFFKPLLLAIAIRPGKCYNRAK
jgi:hypothetical protein